jgi:D-proline reductase (dithiol) PrdB
VTDHPRRQPPVDYIGRIRAFAASEGYPAYRWVESAGPPPWSALRKPVDRSRLALISSGGIYAVGQIAFHYRNDTSLRLVDTRVNSGALRATHFGYDLTAARSDPNVVFPVDTLGDLQARGELGELAATAYTFMGGIYSARKVEQLLAPAIVERLLSDQVDLALLVPV